MPGWLCFIQSIPDRYGGDILAKQKTAPDQTELYQNAYKYANRPFKWFLQLIRPVRFRYLMAISVNLVFVLLSVIPATVTGWLVDDVLTDRRMELLPGYLALLVGVPLLRSFMMVFYRYHFEYSAQDSIVRLRRGTYRHLQNLDALFYSRTRPGDIMAKLTGDMDMIRHFIAFTVFSTLENSVLFIFGTFYVFTVNWKLALIALLVSPVTFIITYRLGRTIRPIWGEIREQFSRLNSVVQQNIAGNRVIRAFARYDFEEEKFEKENQGYRQAHMKHADMAVRFIPALEAMANFMTVLVILIGGLLVIFDELSLGGLVTFNGLLFILNNPMRSAGNLMNEVQRYSTSANKVLDLLIERSRIKSPDQDQKDMATADSESAEELKLSGKVEFRDVTFTYGERKGHALQPSLKNISLTAEPGQTIGLVGLTGSGKTSLVSLIPRLYDTTFGEILIDGVDVREYNLQQLRRNIGMVMQEVFLFSDTIEGNIAYGVPEAPMSTVYEAAKTAAADDFITRTPEGYDTIIGERGVGLSGGQRQRLALARALAIKPSILILDDTTSAVDMETEHEIQQALRRMPGRRTLFIIAHRISSVRYADEILVIEDGEVVERGRHDDLMALRGRYYDIFLTQAGMDDQEFARVNEGGESDGT